MARKLYPASNPRDDRLFDELFYRQEILHHRNPVVSLVTPGEPNTSFDVHHDLGRVPRGYLLIRSSAPCQIYDGDGTWDARSFSLRATAGEVEVEILIL